MPAAFTNAEGNPVSASYNISVHPRVSPDVVTERDAFKLSVDGMSNSVADTQKYSLSVRDSHRETPKSNPNILNGVGVRKLSPPADSYNRLLHIWIVRTPSVGYLTIKLTKIQQENKREPFSISGGTVWHCVKVF